MRILYHHRTQGEEPESVHIRSVVAALRRAGHEVDLIGPVDLDAPGTSGHPQDCATARLRRGVSSRAFIELAQLAYNLVSFCALATRLRTRRYDFIYERHALYNVAGLLASRLFRLPRVLEVNTPYAHAWTKYYGLHFAPLARLLERKTLRGAHAIITVTSAQRAYLERDPALRGRIRVSHNAIDPALFDPARFDTDAIRRRLSVRGVVVGFVGMMNRWQGMPGFTEVITNVAAGVPLVTFLFVGDGECRVSLERELRRRGLAQHAIFAGRQPHAGIPEVIAAMDICVLLDSNAYGSPMKVFEYGAMAKPMIAPAVPPVLEVLTDGVDALLIPPGDAAQMSRAIQRLAADPGLRARLGQNARTCVLRSHTWDRNARVILAALGACPTRTADSFGSAP